TPDVLLSSMRAARDGALALPRDLFSGVLSRVADSAPTASSPTGLDHLTDRELQVLDMIAGGRTDRETAEMLGISIRTVEAHVGNILRRLGAPNRAAAASLFRSARR